MGYEFLFAKRYLTQKKSTGFISLITWFSITGITIGIAAITITLAVLDGFEKTVKSKLVEFYAHVTVETFHREGFIDYESVKKQIMDVGDAESISAFINKEAMVKYKNFVEGISLKGVFEKEAAGNLFAAKQIVEGDFTLASEMVEKNGVKSEIYPLILGKNLAERLGIKIGETVFLISTEGMKPSVSSQPYVKRFVLKGVFDAGYYEIDESFGFTSIKGAQALFKMDGKITGFELRLEDPDLADEFASRINRKIGYPFNAGSWRYLNTTLFAWMEVQKQPIMIVFSLISIVAIINLFSTLIMIVFEKKKDIGILKSMGAFKKSILKIFFYEGVFIGVTGVVSGGILSFILCRLQQEFNLIKINKEVYFMDKLPIEMSLINFIWIAAVTMILCMLGSLVPSFLASRLLPIKTIRDEN